MTRRVPIRDWSTEERKTTIAFAVVIAGTTPRILFTVNPAIVVIVMSATEAARVVMSWYAIPVVWHAQTALPDCVRGAI